MEAAICESAVKSLKNCSGVPETDASSLFLPEALVAGRASLLYNLLRGGATEQESGIAKLRYRSSDSGLAQVSVLTLSRYRYEPALSA